MVATWLRQGFFFRRRQQDFQLIARVQDTGRQLGQDPSQLHTGQHAPGHDEIKGQGALKMLGRFEFTLLDPAAVLERPVPLFDAPTPAIPLHFLPSLLGAA